MTFEIKNVVVVGIGGVGIPLTETVCRYVAHKAPHAHILLMDGDTFEPRNRERQAFAEVGNKADVKVRELKGLHPELMLTAVPEFITADNAYLYIPDGSIVFCCPDNHATRKVISDHCVSLTDTLLISGGNAFDSGSVQLYKKVGGREHTRPLTYLHPEIESPQDRNPAEMSCDERAAQGVPQLIFANLAVASRMLEAFWMATTGEVKWDTLYFSLITGAQRTIHKGD